VIQSVDRAAQILHALGSGTPALGVTELAERLGLAKPTVHGLLRTLEQSMLVGQEASGKYCLGPAVLQLGNAYLAGSGLRSAAMLRAGTLARRVNEAVWVAVLAENEVMVVHHEFRPDDAVQILEVGATIPWHACALGHAIVAHLDDDERAVLERGPLRALTGRTKTAGAALERALGKVRRDGYAVENQEANVGDAGLAAPVFDHAGRVLGAIGVVGPADRLLQTKAREMLSRAVLDTCRAVSRDLGATRSALGERSG
jgi:DNA-binding IclR family transcriptional regulator